jgi:hypothetical protein
MLYLRQHNQRALERALPYTKISARNECISSTWEDFSRSDLFDVPFLTGENFVAQTKII